jgi:G3E family GTPase
MQVRTLIYCHPCSSEVQQGANPYALIPTTTNGQIENKRILKTNRFDFERSMESPGWGVKLCEEVNSEVDEYGIGSFVYRARRPFHPRRFWDAMQAIGRSVASQRGFLASYPSRSDGNLEPVRTDSQIERRQLLVGRTSPKRFPG